jgi:hypothetical protein
MTTATTRHQVRNQVHALASQVDGLPEAWGSWQILERMLNDIESWLAKNEPIVYDFTIPRNVRVRGARTHVEATNVTPANWDVEWAWLIDGAERAGAKSNPADLDTSDLAPGDHTLSVTATFLGPRQRTSTAPSSPGTKAPAGAAAGASAGPEVIVDQFKLGPHLVEALLSEGIVTQADVVHQLGRPLQRLEFSARHDLNVEEVQRVARLVEMTRLPAVTPRHALLMERARVESPRQLAQRNPANFHVKLTSVREAEDDPEVTLDEVVAWINAVDGLEFKVFNEDAD